MNRRSVGWGGEAVAAGHLERDGYRIIERNFSCRAGEIDIIAEKDGVTCFVEVKLRRSREFGSPLDAVTPTKRRRLVRAAQYYCILHGIADKPVSFHVIGIDRSGDTPVIEHVPDAFPAS